MEKINLACLHGFLGRPSDWDLIQSHFMVSSFARRFEWWSVDYMNTPVLSPRHSLDEWAAHFNQKMQLKFAEGPRILLGYSLGGRLALQAFSRQPDLYDALILISTHPGLVREKDREERRQNDLIWSQKFFQAPWGQVMEEWNSQAVFKGGMQEPERQETDYQRDLLTRALMDWSLSRQQDFRPAITAGAGKILWITGEKDIKFQSLAMELQRLAPGLQSEIVTRASHRVLFDNPGATADKAIRFLADKFLD